MNSTDIILNIAVNLGRIGRFAMEGREQRVQLFISDTDTYIDALRQQNVPKSLQSTCDKFISSFAKLKIDPVRDESWIESIFTWQNILTHRVKIV